MVGEVFQNALGLLRPDARTAAVAVRLVSGEGLVEVPVGGLVFVHFEVPPIAHVVVATGDGLHVLVDGHQHLVPWHQLSAGHQNAQHVVPFEGRTEERLVVVKEVLPNHRQDEGLALVGPVGLVGGQDILTPVHTIRQGDDEAFSLELVLQPFEEVLHVRDGVLLLRVQGPQAIPPVGLLLGGGSELVGNDVPIQQNGCHYVSLSMNARRSVQPPMWRPS